MFLIWKIHLLHLNKTGTAGVTMNVLRFDFAFVLSKMYSDFHKTNGPPHDKSNKMTVLPAKTQISLRICPVWLVFVCMKKALVLNYPLSAQQRLWSDWVDAQADLSLPWAQSFCWFYHEATQIDDVDFSVV